MLYTALRWISLAEALVLIGWAIAVMQEAKRFRPPNIYVRLVTASYIMLVVTAAIHAAFAKNVREPDLLVWFRVIALTYGIGAMVFMWRHYSYEQRLKRHGDKSAEQAARLRKSAGLDD